MGQSQSTTQEGGLPSPPPPIKLTREVLKHFGEEEEGGLDEVGRWWLQGAAWVLACGGLFCQSPPVHSRLAVRLQCLEVSSTPAAGPRELCFLEVCRSTLWGPPQWRHPHPNERGHQCVGPVWAAVSRHPAAKRRRRVRLQGCVVPAAPVVTAPFELRACCIPVLLQVRFDVNACSHVRACNLSSTRCPGYRLAACRPGLCAAAGSSLAASDQQRRHSRSHELRASGEQQQQQQQFGEQQPVVQPPPAPAPRGGSTDSGSDAYSAAGSARSSFALERASVEANRASLEAFKEAFASGPLMPPRAPPPQPSPPTTPTSQVPVVTLAQLADAAQLPPALREKFARLAVIPANTPAPASMLAKLWQTDALDVKASLAFLASKGILNVAQLPDGRVWCLPQAQQLALITAAARELAPAYHRLLLDAYCSSLLPSISEEAPEQEHDMQYAQQAAAAGMPGLPMQQQQHAAPAFPGMAQQQHGMQAPQHSLLALPQRLRDLPDDGYILVNLGHHLMAAGRHQQVGCYPPARC